MSPSSPRPGLLISLGGNALNVPDSPHPHQKEEFIVARKSLEGVVTLLERGYEKIVLCHGNGPQVGQIFMQQELTRHEFPRQVTLDVCVADSQGRIGYIIQNVLDNLCRERGVDRKAFAVITQVEVANNDPAFTHPLKPIGLFYSQEEAEKLKKENDWQMVEDSGRGYRRVVPSPQPLGLVEEEFFKTILDQGYILIGGGGGGIPVIRQVDGQFYGVEGVIDKDHTSALMATKLGLDILVILTSVEHVFLDFKSPSRKAISRTTRVEMENWLKHGEFAEGSMKPKVEAALKFLDQGGQKVIIAHLFHLVPALEGKTGTHIRG
ncbi:MAG: carbamate kinase [Candidatus Nitronauta litoralis]|uniref:Carbamate kinase n=1 Tax=Candidatus Nitronauta litoralis TaxID=2705533 RepID=A0A7T0BV95_9BACT|nr:MAG: carbamate kinase [Candidatus Nitronauta litoralis]